MEKLTDPMLLGKHPDNNFGARFEFALQERELTQADAARMTIISPATINKYVKGVYEPSIWNLAVIVQKLHMDANYLLGAYHYNHRELTSDLKWIIHAVRMLVANEIINR